MKIKLLITCLLFVPLLSWGIDMISPINFNPTPTNKNKVISFIKYNVKETYSRIGMDSESTLRMMEEEELRCFKELTKVQDINLLKRVKRQYCNIGMCTYSTILMMYNEEVRASKKNLEW
tara:strand:+ start:4343 stop:4702 length:360 start_codon:yes stop_codon:yes gene_type:complete